MVITVWNVGNNVHRERKAISIRGTIRLISSQKPFHVNHVLIKEPFLCVLLYGHLFLCFEFRYGINVNICYVLMCLCVYFVDVCTGRSTGWRDLLYNFGGLHNVQSRECCVIICFHIVKQTWLLLLHCTLNNKSPFVKTSYGACRLTFEILLTVSPSLK